MRKLFHAACFLGAILYPTAAMTGGYAKNCYQQVHVPAVYKTVAERVLVRPASVRHHTIPARYGVKHVNVVVQPERQIAQTVPAVHKTIHQKVLISHGHTAWEWRVRGGKKIYCEVKYPPKYGTVAKTVVVQPARTVYQTVPAITKTIQKRILIEPARTQAEHIPAQYRTVHRQVLVTPARTDWRPIGGRRNCCCSY